MADEAGFRGARMTGDVTVAFAVLLIGAGISFGGTVWLLMQAFSVNRTWGWLCLLCSPAQLAFVVLNFATAWRPFAFQTAGSLLVFFSQTYLEARSPGMFDFAAARRDRTHSPARLVEQPYIPVPGAPPKDDDPGRLILLSPVAATATIDGAPAPVPVEVALPPGFHDIVITDEAGQTTALRARIARRGTTKICWNFASVNYCNVPQLAEAEKRW